MKEDALYINREISWLDFNARVLQEAADQNVPLLADQIYPRVEINALIDGKPVDDPRLASYWHRLSGDSFHPQGPTH